MLAGAGFLRLAKLFEVQTIDKLGMDGGFEFLLFLFAQRPGGGRRSPQSGTTVPEVAAVRARLREVQSKVAHRYSVLFWAPNKEKPLRAAG